MDDDLVQQWEYHIEYMRANVTQKMDFIQQLYPPGQVPRYAVQATLPRLHELGSQGWELVEMTPVKLGVNGDILISGGDSRYFSNEYQCVFKRRKR